MSTIENEKENLQRLKIVIAELLTFAPEKLDEDRKLGPFNFDKGLPYFKRTLELVRSLDSADLQDFPQETLEGLAVRLEEARDRLVPIHDFDPEAVPEPAKVRDAHLDKFMDTWHGVHSIIFPILAYTAQRSGNLDDVLRRAGETLTEVQKIKDDAEVQKQIGLNEVDEILKAARAAAAETGVSEHQVHFRDEAVKHEGAAEKWLYATLGMGVAAIAWVGVFLLWLSSPNPAITRSQAIQIGVGKVAIFSIIYFGILMCWKNYRANQHNFISNRHRENSLKTFMAFVKSTDDPSTKNAVLVKSTDAIFSPPVTGYLSKEPDGPGSPQILEIFRGAMRGGEG